MLRFRLRRAFHRLRLRLMRRNRPSRLVVYAAAIALVTVVAAGATLIPRWMGTQTWFHQREAVETMVHTLPLLSPVEAAAIASEPVSKPSSFFASLTPSPWLPNPTVGVALPVTAPAVPSLAETSGIPWLASAPDAGLHLRLPTTDETGEPTTPVMGNIQWHEPQGTASPAPPYVPAHAALVMDNTTGTVLYAQNAHQKRAPASTTKIVTAIIALERGRLDDMVTVSAKAASTRGSTARLYTGQQIRMEDLIHGLLLSSGNDAAVAIAEHMAGSVENFADVMNERAKTLGALNTQFKNPHGLDEPGHYSTAYDLALLTRFAMLYPQFQAIIAKRTYASDGGSWGNTNELLWRFEGASGVKTGTTGNAGYCLVASVEREGMQLISVVLGARDRYRDTMALLNYAYDNFRVITLAERGDLIGRIPLPKHNRMIEAVAARPLRVVVTDEHDTYVSTRFTVSPGIKTPLRFGSTVGTLDVIVDDRVVQTVPLLAGESIAAPSLWERFMGIFRTSAAPSQPVG